MAEIWGAAIVVAGGLAAANQQKKGAQGAANAQERANQASIDEQRRQFDLTRQDQMPWLNFGKDALGQLGALNSGDYSGFENSPDYLYARDQGVDGINRQLAAHGGYYSGGGDADRMEFLSGLATQNLGNYRGALQSAAGMGQSTASGLGSMGMGMANSIGSLLQNSGQARATSYQNRADTNTQLFGGIAQVGGGLFGNYMGNRSTQAPAGYAGTPAYYGGNVPTTPSGANWMNGYGLKGN